MNEEKNIGSFLEKIKDEIDHLANEDLGTVGKGLFHFFEEELNENPYQTLATAVGIGFGLGSLKKDDIKSGALHLGRLIAMRALSGMDTKKISTGGNHAVSKSQQNQ